MTMSTIIDPSKELAGHSWRMLIDTLHCRKGRRAMSCNRKPQLIKTIERNIARGKRTRAIVMQALAELGEANSNQLRDKTGLTRVCINASCAKVLPSEKSKSCAPPKAYASSPLRRKTMQSDSNKPTLRPMFGCHSDLDSLRKAAIAECNYTKRKQDRACEGCAFRKEANEDRR